MSNRHYTIKNNIGGSYCKKCLEWSSMPDGLKDGVCKATRKEAKKNINLIKDKLNTK